MRMTNNDEKNIFNSYHKLYESGPVANMGRGAPGSTANQINVGSSGPVIPKSPIAALKGEVPSTSSPSPEKNEEECQGESLEMAKRQLISTADKSIELFDMIHNEHHGIEAWAASKITLAEDYINTVYDYMKYKSSDNQTTSVEVKHIDSMEDLDV